MDVYEKDLKAAVWTAIQEHGRSAGIADKKGVTNILQWSNLVRSNGHKVPDLHRWFAAEGQRWSVESLLNLGRIFASYEVEVGKGRGKKVMPPDYFLSILVNGRYKAFAKFPEEKPSDVTTTVAWIKKQLSGLPANDRIAVLTWFLGLMSRGFRVEDEELPSQSHQ